MSEILAFFLLSLALLYVSRCALVKPNSHGFYRFFAWEAILGLVLFDSPASADPVIQLLSTLFLLSSLGLVIHAVALLMTNGKPTHERTDDALFYFEKTSSLVTRGAFRYIRHPMYASLFFLTWGEFLKKISWLGFCLALTSSFFLLLAARREEEECLAHFGTEYQRYMKKTKRFIPFLY
jgi:protein-S-isoprenylcysteine O-methyltransferase Ste14